MLKLFVHFCNIWKKKILIKIRTDARNNLVNYSIVSLLYPNILFSYSFWDVFRLSALTYILNTEPLDFRGAAASSKRVGLILCCSINLLLFCGSDDTLEFYPITLCQLIFKPRVFLMRCPNDSANKMYCSLQGVFKWTC